MNWLGLLGTVLTVGDEVEIGKGEDMGGGVGFGSSGA